MRMPCVALLLYFCLTACDFGPTFDASSLPAYQNSLKAITATLSADDQRRLAVALMTLALGDSPQSNAFELANPGSIADLVSLAGVANPLIYLDRLRPGIDGRSAAAVISRVATDLDDEISRAEASSGGADKLLADVKIDSPRFYWDARSHLPTIEFSAYNGGRTTISRINVSGVMTQHGRTGKWTTGGLNYIFETGLGPGDERPVKLTARVFSAQTAKQLQNLYDADFTLKVTNIVYADGHKLIPVDTDALAAMRQKRDFLRGS
jgi:hypothetical protein